MSRHIAFKSYTRRFVSPLRTAHGNWAERRGLIVRIEEGGRVGYGEVAPIPWFGTETLDAAQAFLEQWVPRPEIADDGGRMLALPCCAFGISAALAELKEPECFSDVSVARLLPAGARALEILKGPGHSVFKWKIGVESPEVELAVLQDLLARLKAGRRLRLDANGGLDPATLELWLSVLSAHLDQIEYLEQPLSVGQEQLMAEAMQRSGVPIALDESLNGAEGRHWLKPGAWAGPLVIKPALMGNVEDLLMRLRPVAKQVVLSSVFETAVGRRNALRLAAELSELQYAIGFDTQAAFEDELGAGDVWSQLVGTPRRGVRLADRNEGPSLSFGQAYVSGERSSRREDPTFEARIKSRKDDLQELRRPERGILLVERDPIAFTVTFLAAVDLRIPIILANPNWKMQELAELSDLVSPVAIFGDLVLPESSVESMPIPAGSILIPTGGSSGGVKLAIHTWGSLSASARGLQKFLGGGPIDSCCCLPLYHVSGLMQMVRAVVTEGRITFSDENPEGKCLSLVPTQLQRILVGTSAADINSDDTEVVPPREVIKGGTTSVSSASRLQQLRSAKAIFVGGAPLSETLAEQAREAELPIVPVYGMTETAAMAVAQNSADFLSGNYLPQCGQALPHTQVDVLDARGALCPVGVPGRIRIQSQSLFQGYWGRPALDLSKGYLTDDEGVLDADGRLTILGRMDRLIITGGEKVDPREVEAALVQCAGVREALVVGRPDAEWGQRVCAYVVGQNQSIDSLRAQLKNSLAPYKVPKDWNFVDRLPFDEKGKIRV